MLNLAKYGSLLGCTPSTIDLEPEQDSDTHHVLVEEITEQWDISLVERQQSARVEKIHTESCLNS
jgi:hypothetical protein